MPGWIDVKTGYLNIQGVSPYSQPPPLQGPGIQVFDKLPEYSTGNSRYGFKFQTVIDRDYNLSLWFYRTFPITPIPTLKGISAENKYVTTTLNHGLANVIGGALSWYSELLTSVVRTEVVLFNDEPAMLAYKNIGSAIASGFTKPGKYETANMLRGEFGVDHNFFVPVLNPSSSFLAIMSVVFQANLTRDRQQGLPHADHQAQRDRARAQGWCAGRIGRPGVLRQPERAGPKECDFVNQSVFEAFAQATIRSDFMGGRMLPQLTTIGTTRGALLFSPSLLYRFSDSFLFDVKYVNTHTFGSENNGYTPGVGLVRDRDQFWFRATYQLN